MPKPNQVDVELTLGKFGRADKLRAAVQSAWDAVSSNEDLAWWRRKSTRAAQVWEHAVQNVIAVVADDPGAVVLPHHDTVSFIFDDRVLMRLKKADMSLMSRNVDTNLALAFFEHEEDLFGYEGLQRVELVYVLDRFGSGIDWIGIVARENRRVLWKLRLQEELAEAVPLPLPEPVSPARQAKLKRASEAPKKAGDKSSG